MKNLAIKGMIFIFMISIFICIQDKRAEANNYVDTSFNQFYTGYTLVKTTYRYKSDDSSAYIYNSGSTCGVYVDVWGAYGVFEDNIFYPRPDKEANCNYNGTVFVGQGQSRKLLNNVKENPAGYNAAQLRMSGAQSRVYLSGVWSPDSI